MKAKLIAFGSTVATGALALVATAHMAVDADVASSSAAVTTNLVTNVKGAITANIGEITIAGALLLVIALVWKYGKKFLR